MAVILTNRGVVTMARARRAQPRHSRALIALIVVALVAGGGLAALRLWPGSITATGSIPTPAAVTPPAAVESSPAAPATSSAAPAPSASAEPTASATPASEQAVREMESCRERVRTADTVLEQARTGISHWESHVGAERDAEKGKISADRQQAIFTETRLKGPADQKRYADAQRAYERARDASCGKADGADAKVVATLAACNDRADAQAPVLKAAGAAMGDWKSHLAAMQRSRDVHVDNAQEIWLKAYRSAPKNIDAYTKAQREFDAPSC